MMSKYSRSRTVIAAVACLCLSILSPGPISAEETSEVRQIRQIAVMPVFKGKKPDKSPTLMICPLGRICTEAERLADGAENTITAMLQKAMDERYGARVIDQEKAAASYNKQAGTLDEVTPMDLAIRMGKELNAGYVLVGNVWRFTERSGGPIGTAKPASVAFDLHLIDVAREATLWEGSFDKVQQALTEDLFQAGDFIKQGGRWVTAEELALFGARETIKNMPLPAGK
jgi:TolB-like protein